MLATMIQIVSEGSEIRMPSDDVIIEQKIPGGQFLTVRRRFEIWFFNIYIYVAREFFR